MQIVHGGDAIQPFQILANCVWIDIRRHQIESHRKRVAEQTPCSPNNHRIDNQTRHRIDPAHPRQENQEACNDNTSRDGCICRHVKECASNIEITLAPGVK